MTVGVQPQQWLAVSLEDVILRIVGGGTPSKSRAEYYQGIIPWMSVKDMNMHVLEDTVDHISQAAVDNSSTNVIPAGTPIIATRMGLGKIAVANFDSAINQDLKALFLTTGIHRKYFVYWYRSIARTIEQMGTGTTVKGIRLEALKELDFQLPPLAEQQVIAAKLDTLLAQVENTQARLERIPHILKRFRQSVLAAAVSGRLTEKWRKSNGSKFPYESRLLSEIIQEMRNGLSPKPNEDGHGNPILRISSVRPFSVDQSDIRYLEVSQKDRERYSLRAKDLLFTRYNGSIEFVGVCAQVKQLHHNLLLYPDKLIRVRVDKNQITPEFLEIFSASHEAREYIYSLVKSTSGQKGISGKDLKFMEVKLPTLEEQTEIVRRVEQLFAYAEHVEQQVNNALGRVNNLTQSILAKAFRGELTAQWREEHPELISAENSAAALLERIKAERAAMKAAKKTRQRARKS
jgi:type I restriction enzyme S subunit